MKPLLYLFLLVGLIQAVEAQSDSSHYFQEIAQYQQELNDEYADPKESPLLPQDRRRFGGLPFYPIDPQYCFTARFVRTPGTPPFTMPTTTPRALPRSAIYEKYGEVHFTIDGISYQLPVYQSHQLRETEEYRDHLFFPFTDLTNGDETYGGGRYLDLSIPEGDTVVVDFNKAYHPYCAYNPKYSCPITPKENNLPVAIRAGVRLGEGKD